MDVLAAADKSFGEQQSRRKILVTAGRTQHDAGIEPAAGEGFAMFYFELQGLFDRDEVGVGQRWSAGWADPADGRNPNRGIHAAKYLSAARDGCRQLTKRDRASFAQLQRGVDLGV